MSFFIFVFILDFSIKAFENLLQQYSLFIFNQLDMNSMYFVI